MTKAKCYELFGKFWANLLFIELNSPEFIKLANKLQTDRNNNIIVCPKKEDTFKAFRMCNFEDIKVVILGLNPYHSTTYSGIPVASGLAFGINTVIPAYVPPSLKNILKELEDDLCQFPIDFDYTLESWAKQGILLLNTALTVQKGNADSHNVYWQPFTKRVMEVLNTYTSNTVFILLGSNAKLYKQYLDNSTFKIIECDDIINSKIFSKTNSYLKEPINWLEYYD